MSSDVKLTSFNNYNATERDTDKVLRKRTVPPVHDKEQTANGSTGEATEAADETKKTVTQEILEFCSCVSVLGVRYVAHESASTFRRCIWALLVIGGVAFTVYHLQGRVRHYFSYPVNVIIRDKHVNELRFPTVTICNENRVSLAKIKAIGKTVCLSSAQLIQRVHISSVWAPAEFYLPK